MFDHKEYRRVRVKRFVDYKKTLACLDCGNPDHRVLQFHHKDPNDIHRLPSGLKRRIPQMIRTSSWETLMDYVSKCDVLCANCHAIRHYDKDISF